MKLLINTTVITGLCLGLLFTAGCQSPFGKTEAITADAEPPAGNVRITYTTASDRLNVVTAGAAATQFASYQTNPASLLPNLTRSTLQVRLPHPSGRQDLAQAVLVSRREDDSESNILTRFWDAEGDDSLPHDKTVAVWELDIPKWQVDAIQTRLEQEQFFRRSRVLEAEIDLSYKDDEHSFSKRFRAIPELDALVLRVAREGTPRDRSKSSPAPTTASPALVRFPPVR